VVTAFKGLDVLAFAIEVEKNGRDFYKAMVERINDQKTKELLFLSLAQEEEKHIVDFESLLDKASGNEPAESYQGEYMDYVKALADNHVFSKDINVTKLANNVNSSEDALDLALRFEKDSILFFTELRRVVFSSGQSIIDELIQQEHDHILTIVNLKNQL
jgi:rubrerythrin